MKKTLSVADLPPERRARCELARRNKPKTWAQLSGPDKDELLKAALERMGMWIDPE
uniref:Uncharacterized protein n=1 Tax=viral metagenome TaxID=1070528 RepID=A0A6M3IIQ0_9ZZZZ